MLMSKEKSALIVVDIQEKLTPHVREPELLVGKCQWITRLAYDLHVPVLVSEQYPSRLGKTVEPLRTLTASEQAIEKVCFSCNRENVFSNRWQALGKTQAVIIGIETHVCVMQTALDMKCSGVDVYVVTDAISSRHEQDHACALARMQQAGVHLVTSEMVFFEWVERAGNEEFKRLSNAYIQKK